MKEMDLMNAMTGLDDDLLERESGAKIRRFGLSKMAVIAAVVALLSVTVFAAVVGIEYRFGRDGTGGGLNVNYPFETVTLRQETYDELAQRLNQDWKERVMPELLSYDEEGYEGWKTCLLGMAGPSSMMKVKNLAELEEYLGIELVVSPEMEELIELNSEYNFGEDLPGSVLLRGPAYEDARKEYEATGSVSLLAIEINLSMNNGTEGLTDLQVIVPLSEEYAKYYPTTWIYSFEKEGETYEYDNGNREIVVAKRDFTGEYASHYGSHCVALYSEGGIGYYLRNIVYPTDRGRNIGEVEAEEVVLPLIENIE